MFMKIIILNVVALVLFISCSSQSDKKQDHGGYNHPQMATCSAKTKFPGFSINNVELGQCFNSTRSGKETVYKLVAVCPSGGYLRNAFVKFVSFAGERVDRPITPWSVQKLYAFKVKKTKCPK